MSKALMQYLKNIKGKDIDIEEKSIVTSIDLEPKKRHVINISKTSNNQNKSNYIKDLGIDKQYKVTVKLYMTKPDSANFTFHATWNNGKAMPLRIMYGNILESTKNMIKMKLHGNITETSICMKCGKVLTNEISKLYGLGPECGQHYYINPLSKQEFDKYKESIKNKLNTIEWEGWIPKVSIISMEEING